MQAISNWDGDEWENWCILLIRRRYGADQVQVVPAKHRGDLGIEAFTFDGCAFQCYAAQEPTTVKDRYEKQRDKLTRDLTKLVDRQDKFLQLLGSVRINRYIFMVPFFDSHELVQHASGKTEEFRAKHLPHLTEDFHIVVIDEDAYADVREEVIRRPQPLVVVQDHSQDEVSAWIEANSQAVETADRKLRGVIEHNPTRIKAIEGLITQYIKGENALSAMRDKFPDSWENTTRYRNHKEQLLIFQYPSMDISFNSLAIIAKEIETDLGQEIPALDSMLRSALSWATIADWIMRCPLDFPSVAS
ncbi:hypothetical protein [Actinomadura bangladeshensis]|uniref:Uncharacterized protein n=1 Tax=Actinomadura bangladeshensis TaxID=453573 RepID=A0A6L9QS49_9ACTN|nr:hypothetical protein [Actinomadura bangladeshensis]NEA27996.1 hypothetical protein [Actinomadura bangladeshensis]